MIWLKMTVNDCENCHWQEVDNLSEGLLESDSVCCSEADLNWSEMLDNMERCSSFNDLHELVLCHATITDCTVNNLVVVLNIQCVNA